MFHTLTTPSHSPRSALSQAKEKDGLIPPEALSWATDLRKEGRKEKKLSIWREVAGKKLVQGTQLLLSWSWQNSHSVRTAFGQHKAKHYFWGCIDMCRIESPTRAFFFFFFWYDFVWYWHMTVIRKVLLRQHLSNGCS